MMKKEENSRKTTTPLFSAPHLRRDRPIPATHPLINDYRLTIEDYRLVSDTRFSDFSFLIPYSVFPENQKLQ
jgi:hypothetical protein